MAQIFFSFIFFISVLSGSLYAIFKSDVEKSLRSSSVYLVDTLSDYKSAYASYVVDQNAAPAVSTSSFESIFSKYLTKLPASDSNYYVPNFSWGTTSKYVDIGGSKYICFSPSNLAKTSRTSILDIKSTLYSIGQEKVDWFFGSSCAGSSYTLGAEEQLAPPYILVRLSPPLFVEELN